MRGERRLLRVGEYLIARACRHLPAGSRDERYREWAAELPAILADPEVRPAARRAARMLRYANRYVIHANRRLGYFPEPDAHGPARRGRSGWVEDACCRRFTTS